jgi:hypothetical protein
LKVKFDDMRAIITIIALLFTVQLMAQSEENMKQLWFVNAERPLDGTFWMKGEYLEVTLNSKLDGISVFQIPIQSAVFETKYELSQGDGQNLWFLYISCKENKGCISPTGWTELVIAISEHRERAENVLKGLRALK